MVAEIPPEQAENDGWPQRAMPAMLAALELAEAPELFWFVAGTSPLYDKAPVEGWRYCHLDGQPDLYGIAYSGPDPKVYLRADVNVWRVIETLGHELWHVREFARGEPSNEEAADAFGSEAANRFWRSQYR